MRGERLDLFMQTFHENGRRWQRRGRKGQRREDKTAGGILSSQSLQITFTLGIIIPVLSWIFMAY